MVSAIIMHEYVVWNQEIDWDKSPVAYIYTYTNKYVAKNI